MGPAPVNIRVDRAQRQVVIDWSDGYRHAFPWHYLRANCPSAGERTARENANPLAVLSKLPSSDLVDARLIGNYAIGFTWADGHDAGIYSWIYLRELAKGDGVEESALA